MRYQMMSCMYVVLFFLFFVFSLSGQENEKKKKAQVPNVYVDCSFCDRDYIKAEIPFVNYVRERAVADIHILVTIQGVGGGGDEYTFRFIGQHDFEGLIDTLTYVSTKLDTDHTIRKGITKTIKMGLVRYIARTVLSDAIIISHEEKEEIVPVEDKWKNWVFSVSVRGSFSGESKQSFNSLYGSLSVNRITEAWKTNMHSYYSYSGSSFEINDTIIIESFSEGYGLSGSHIKGIDEHWSIGLWVSVYSSDYYNMKGSFYIAPAIEFNIFPYSEYTSRELKIEYKPTYKYRHYFEETIYDKVQENLFNESLSITYETKQKWGKIWSTLEGSHYFHDFSKNRLTFYSNLSLKMLKGLSFDLYGRISRIRDQLSLSKKGLTLEEILLQRRQLETHYEYYVSLGLSYTFGSVYSNIVNPRF